MTSQWWSHSLQLHLLESRLCPRCLAHQRGAELTEWLKEAGDFGLLVCKYCWACCLTLVLLGSSWSVITARYACYVVGVSSVRDKAIFGTLPLVATIQSIFGLTDLRLCTVS